MPLLRRPLLSLSLSRRAVASQPLSRRTFTTSLTLRKEDDSKKHSSGGDADPKPGQPNAEMIPFEDVKTPHDLFGPGAKVGTIPTDLEQATGLERLEILGKMQGIDVFDMKPLDASRLGTMKDPIMVKSFGDEQYCGCTGFPADSHVTKWLTVSRGRPIERCPECGSVYKMEYVGPPDDPHAHEHEGGHHNYEEPKTFADFVKEEYRYS